MDAKNFHCKNNLKINVGCGQNVKSGWVNVDFEERGKKLDLIWDISKGLPFDDESCSYIYSEHFIEHLNWLDGLNYFIDCYRCLQKGGVLRTIFPNFKDNFTAYVQGNKEYFKSLSVDLDKDFAYYSRLVDNPLQVKRERKNNPGPAWHYSKRYNNRRKIMERARKYQQLIDYLDYSVYQYGEHKALYDDESMISILKQCGFSSVKKSDFKEDIDSKSRINASSYIMAIK